MICRKKVDYILLQKYSCAMEDDFMRLYHGSLNIIERPTPLGGKVNNDYGRGFYCTEHKELASEWAVEKNRDGFVNIYEFDNSNLQVLNLRDDKYSILHWITVLIENRKVSLGAKVQMDAQDYLIKKYHIDVNEYDVIKGYRADDSYFAFVRAFLSNTISLSQLQSSMMLGDLGEQVFIRSKEAFDRLKFIDVISVNSDEYYPLKKTRDLKAQHMYEEIINKYAEDDLFIKDLMKGAYVYD